MPDDSTNSRLSRLEDDVAELRRDLRNDVKGLHEKVDSILAAVATMSKGQGIEDVRIRGELEAVKSHMCPKPGACVDLLERMDKVEHKVSTMHDMIQQAKGGGKVIAGIWGAIGASVVGFVVWLATHFITTGKP
jgi:hypothetical protein